MKPPPPRRRPSVFKTALLAILLAIVVLQVALMRHTVERLGSGNGGGSGGSNHDIDGFVASYSNNNSTSLKDTRISFEVTTMGLSQWGYLQEVLGGVRDLCIAGANVHLHITTSDCDYTAENNRCKEKRGSVLNTTQNYPPLILSQINELTECHPPSIHYYSPTYGKYLMDFHRKLFYEEQEMRQQKNLQPFDLFIHTEEDTVVTPANVLAYLQQTALLKERLAQRNLLEHFHKFSIGFMRYENLGHDRIIWEFDWRNEQSELNELPLPIQDNSPLQFLNNFYFTSPPPHHQGMYMATKEQLELWKEHCSFNIPSHHSGYHIEHVSGGLDLYDDCGVLQLLPLSSADAHLIHHLPDANHKRRPKEQLLSTLELHELRMKRLSEVEETNDNPAKYHGATITVHDVDPKEHPVEYDSTAYNAFVKNGGRLY